MRSNAEKILSLGLETGYAGGSERLTVKRGPFELKATELSFPELDAKYNDHWIFKRVGGGQEIAMNGDEMATRVFAGGIVKPEILKNLGISEEQILAFHKTQLSQLAHTTRLHEDIRPDPDGDWQYKYEVMKDYPDLPLTIGVETITYKGQQVFVHVFLNSPIA